MEVEKKYLTRKKCYPLKYHPYDAKDDEKMLKWLKSHIKDGKVFVGADPGFINLVSF